MRRRRVGRLPTRTRGVQTQNMKPMRQLVTEKWFFILFDCILVFVFWLNGFLHFTVDSLVPALTTLALVNGQFLFQQTDTQIGKNENNESHNENFLDQWQSTFFICSVGTLLPTLCSCDCCSNFFSRRQYRIVPECETEEARSRTRVIIAPT